MNEQSMVSGRNEPGALDASIVGALDRIEQRLARLEGGLAQLDAVGRQGPGAIAALTDTLDSLTARLADSGVDVDERMRTSLRLLERFTAPGTVSALEMLLGSSVVDERKVGTLVRLADAVATEAGQKPAAVGPWGVLRALRDRDVQHALGLLLGIAKRVGASIAEPERVRLPRNVAAAKP